MNAPAVVETELLDELSIKVDVDEEE